jgi:RNA recognition motif-containing protein
MNKLYVGNLSYSVTESDLEDFFSQYGELNSVAVVKDRNTNRSKGFGFVEYSDASSAKKALSADGQDFKGRNIKVNMATEKARR